MDLDFHICVGNWKTASKAVSPPERCDLDGVKLEKVHELFQVFIAVV